MPRVPQLTDDVHVDVRLSPQTEQCVEELLQRRGLLAYEFERTDSALSVRKVVHGNCTALTSVILVLQDLDDALRGWDIDVMELRVTATTKEAS